MYDIRRQEMSRLINERERISIKELQQIFPGISLMTIHRDLDALESTGLIVKVRGGARSVHHKVDPSLEIRSRENLAGKTIVAQKAAELAKGATCVFLDSGTTCIALAKIMPDTPMTIVTTGPNVALVLARLKHPEVTLCPGTLNKENLTVSGQSTLEFLGNINIDIAFIGVSGYGKTEGFTCGRESEMAVKRRVIRHARQTVILCDHTKLSRVMPFTFAKLEEIDCLAIDKELPKDLRELADLSGVTVL